MVGASRFVGCERAAESSESALEPFAAGGCTNSENLRDLVVREAVRSVEFENDGLLIGESLESPEKSPLLLTSERHRLRPRAQIDYIDEGSGIDSIAAPLEQDMTGDRVQPGAETSLTSISGGAHQSALECLLQDVFGIDATNPADDVAKDLIRVPLE